MDTATPRWWSLQAAAAALARPKKSSTCSRGTGSMTVAADEAVDSEAVLDCDALVDDVDTAAGNSVSDGERIVNSRIAWLHVHIALPV